MPSDRAVLNTSPLITLCKSGQEYLLPRLFAEIVVPDAVWDEVLAGSEVRIRTQREHRFAANVNTNSH